MGLTRHGSRCSHRRDAPREGRNPDRPVFQASPRSDFGRR